MGKRGRKRERPYVKGVGHINGDISFGNVEKNVANVILKKVAEQTKDYIVNSTGMPSSWDHYKKTFDTKYVPREFAYLIFNGGEQYRLTHLLNNGHFVVTHGKRTKEMTHAYHFMDKGFDKAQQAMQRAIDGASIDDIFDIDTDEEVW